MTPEPADVLAIHDVLARYAEAVDGRDFDALDEVFTADALVDFTATGGPSGDLASTKAFLAQALPAFARTQHMMGLPRLVLDGKEVTARTPCHNPMVLEHPDGSRTAWLIGLWYEDRLVRTADGWRIRERRQDCAYAVTDLPTTALA